MSPTPSAPHIPAPPPQYTAAPASPTHGFFDPPPSPLSEMSSLERATQYTLNPPMPAPIPTMMAVAEDIERPLSSQEDYDTRWRLHAQRRRQTDDDHVAHQECEREIALHIEARNRGYTVDRDAWDHAVQNREIIEKKFVHNQIRDNDPLPPDGLLYIWIKTGAAKDLDGALVNWHKFNARRPVIANVPVDLTAEDAETVWAIVSNHEITDWNGALLHVAKEADDRDPFLGNPFAKDGAKGNHWRQATGGDKQLESKVRVLLAPFRPTVGAPTPERFTSLPHGLTEQMVRYLAPALQMLARGLVGDLRDADAADPQDDYRAAGAFCMLAGLGARMVATICGANGLPPCWADFSHLAREALRDGDGKLLRARAYIDAVEEAYKVSGMPLAWLRADWSAIATLVKDVEENHPAFDGMQRPLRSALILHLIRYVRSADATDGTATRMLTARYNGREVTARCSGDGNGALAHVLSPKHDDRRNLLDVLGLTNLSPAAEKAVDWVLHNVPASAFPRLAPVGSDPFLVQDPEGVVFAPFPVYGTEFFRVSASVSGVGRFQGGQLDPCPVLNQGDLVRYAFRPRFQADKATGETLAALGQNAVAPQPLSWWIKALFPNWLLPTDPVARRGYIALFDTVMAVSILRDWLRLSPFDAAASKEFPMLCVWPGTGELGSGRGVVQGSEFNSGKSTLSTIIIEVVMGLRVVASMRTTGKESGDVANRSTTMSVLQHGFFLADEFPFAQLAPGDTAGHAFGPDGICRWATGDANTCAMVRKNTIPQPIRYLCVMNGKPYPRMRDDVVSRLFFVFLGPLTKNPKIAAYLADPTLCLKVRMSVLAWLEQTGLQQRITHSATPLEGWRFPFHAHLADLIDPGCLPAVSAAAEWMRIERARIGDEARGEHKETGNAATLSHLIDGSDCGAFNYAWSKAVPGKEPRNPFRYLGTWDFCAFLAMHRTEVTGSGTPDDALRRLFVGTKGSAHQTSSACRDHFERPVIIHGVFEVCYVSKDDSDNPVMNASRKPLAAVRMRRVTPSLGSGEPTAGTTAVLAVDLPLGQAPLAGNPS